MEKDKEKMVQIRISLPEDYRRLFKAICTEQGTDMSKRITELVENELKKAGKISQV
ncbi:copy number control protein [Anabaena sp. UHCC 0187]|uniref:plasmid partition protein ParG n=1 Tax=Anabaena sp. UHCC 0187 TaxID=2590018 RepID=UPI001446753B|nr:plasmid partition protein ParG [Anabaena sp. UHCC 0187]MTJ15269.1 copy number control protein [Anabaena sp. UHCC 0187]